MHHKKSPTLTWCRSASCLGGRWSTESGSCPQKQLGLGIQVSRDLVYMAGYNTSLSLSFSPFVVDIGNLKFARGARFSQMEAQERYKEECQRVFDLQNTSVKPQNLYLLTSSMNGLLCHTHTEYYRVVRFSQLMRRAATVEGRVTKSSAGT